eukprot:6456694-Amphidinium_carterae.1
MKICQRLRSSSMMASGTPGTTGDCGALKKLVSQRSKRSLAKRTSISCKVLQQSRMVGVWISFRFSFAAAVVWSFPTGRDCSCMHAARQ